MMEQLFTVGTEFVFDVGEAVISTNKLTDSVEKLDTASQSAVNSLGFFAHGLIAHLGLGSGGLLSILTKSIQLSQEFQVNQLGFVNSFSSNMKFLTGDINNFNEKLGTSGTIMEDIQGISAKFGIPSTQLAEMTQKLAPPLAQRGKLGKNYAGGIDMAKNIMIGAESMQMNPQVLSDSILGALSGQGLHGKAFARLVNTNAFQESHIKTQQGLMSMAPVKKMELLSKALKDLAMDTDSLAYRMNTIDKQIVSLKESLAPIFKTIGDAIVKPLVKILKEINDFLQKNGKRLGDSIAAFIGNIFEDPKKLFANIYQMKSIKKDFKDAFNFATILDIFTIILPFLSKIKFSGALLRVANEIKTFVIGYVDIARYFITISGIWSAALRAIKYIATTFAYFMILTIGIFGLFQAISRARAIAAANDITGIAKATPAALEALVKWKKVIEMLIMPFQFFVEKLANMIAPLFETGFWLNFILPKLSGLADVLMKLETPLLMITALANGLFNVAVGRKFGATSDLNPLHAFKEGWNDVMSKAHSNGDPTKITQGNVMNVGNYNVTMQFKEQLEPDRIAFSLKEQLYKAMKNQTQARGSSLQGAFANTQFAGGKS